MHDLEQLTDVINAELIDIKVSEELKLKTLNRCKKNKISFFYKAHIPIAWTMVACLLMGVIIYPIYNSSNSMKDKQITRDTSEKEIDIADKQSMDSANSINENDIMKNQNSEIASNEMVDGNQKDVNESLKVSKEENEVSALKDNSTIALKKETSGEGVKKDQSMVAVGKAAIENANGDTIDNDKDIKDSSGNTSMVLSEENVKGLAPNDGVKMKPLSPQEAIKVFGGDIKIPNYIPNGFVLEKILIPEFNYGSNKVYEIIYSNNAQYFKIVKYSNINIVGEVSSNATSLENKTVEESNMIINLNNMPVKYTLQEGINITEPTFVKLMWEDRGMKYSVEGNATFAQMISIVSSIIK